MAGGYFVGVYVVRSRFELPLPWDVLLVATIEDLPGYAPGFVDFASPEILAPGLSVFTLTQSELGDLGKLTLRKSGDRMTLVDVDDPPYPREEEIDPDYLENQKAAYLISQEEYFRVSGELKALTDQLFKRRQEHLQNVILAYSSRLVHDVSIWKANNAFPPLYILAWAGIESVKDAYQHGQYFGDFIKAAVEVQPTNDVGLQTATVDQDAMQKKGPTLRTQERYAVFHQIKKEHPTWSQSKVAMEASPELNESITAETIRNTYRLMGKKWERGDRIR